MNIQERLREKLYPYVTQCKRYKKSLGVLFVLGGIAIGWGIFYTPEADYVQMEPDSTAMSNQKINLMKQHCYTVRVITCELFLGVRY